MKLGHRWVGFAKTGLVGRRRVYAALFQPARRSRFPRCIGVSWTPARLRVVVTVQRRTKRTRVGWLGLDYIEPTRKGLCYFSDHFHRRTRRNCARDN